MADATILIGGYVKRTTNLTDLRFYIDSGYLHIFKFTGITYVHVNQVDFIKRDQTTIYATAGYYNEAKFLEYEASIIESFEIAKHKLNLDKLEKGVVGDRIRIRKLKITAPYTDFCKVADIYWNYKAGVEILDSTFNIIIPPSPESSITISDVNVNSIAKDFYFDKIKLVTNDLGAYTIAAIALQINRIQQDVFPIYNNDIGFKDYITSQNHEWTSKLIFTTPDLTGFQIYLSNISNFYESIYSNQLYIKEAIYETKLYWLADVLSESALSIIPVHQRITLLERIAKGILLGEIGEYIPHATNEEELVLRIVKSIAPQHDDEFLTGLIKNQFFDGESNVSLFQSLYDKINDEGVGEENLKVLMNELYKIWMRSSYFPYNLDGTAKDSLMHPDKYGSNPVLLNYESRSILGVFNYSNYDFNFYNDQIGDNLKIVVSKEEYTYMEPVTTFTTVHVGTYGIYQTVTIKNTDSNTNSTKFLSVNIDGNLKAALPIFYLKYIDDKKSTENLKSTLELTFDLVTTFAGIGNLRHLRHLNKLGRVFLKLEAAVPGQVLLKYELFLGAAGIIELTGSVASLFVKYSDDYQNTYCNTSSSNYDKDKCEFYIRLDYFATFLQLFSGAMDYVTSRQLRNTAQKILHGPIPKDFEPEALSILRKFARDITEQKEIFRVRLFQRYGDESVIWKKINNDIANGGLKVVKQEEFILDFDMANEDVLDALAANSGDLIEYWKEVEFLKKERKLIDFLQAYKFVDGDHCLIHALYGDVLINRPLKNGKLGNTVVDLTGMHNPHQMVLSPNHVNDGKWSFKNNEYVESWLGYRKGKMEYRMSINDIDPQTQIRWKNKAPSTPIDRIYIKSKTSETGVWPISYSTQRIKEEMAYAYAFKKPVPSRKKGILKFSATGTDSMKIVLYKDQYNKWSIFPDNDFIK